MARAGGPDMRRVLESLASGMIVYVVMAACSGGEAADRARAPGTGTGNGDATGAGGAPVADGSVGPTGGATGTGGDVADATVLDRIMNPVKDAAAQSTSGSRLKAKYLVGADG